MQQEFFNHGLTGEEMAKAKELRRAYSDLHERVLQLVPLGPARTQALNWLRTSSFWAVHGLVYDQPRLDAEPLDEPVEVLMQVPTLA